MPELVGGSSALKPNATIYQARGATGESTLGQVIRKKEILKSSTYLCPLAIKPAENKLPGQEGLLIPEDSWL